MRECPLTGKPCDKAAMFNITDIKDGKVTSAKCCEDCFGQYVQQGPKPPELEFEQDSKTSPPSIVSPSDVIQGLLEIMGGPLMGPKPKPKPQRRHEGKKCPGCGCTLGDIAKSGKVGCGQCFETFEKPLNNVLYKAHGSTEHVGKRPKQQEKQKMKEENKPKRKMTLEEQISQQELQMQEAIDVENYERAAALRDSLKLLREKMSQIDNLRTKLDSAVKAEQFEEASKIKAEIDKLR